MDSHKKQPLKIKMKKILAWLEETPSPNEGRVQELKDAIKKGRYPTKKMLLGTADVLISRLQGKKIL